jgi:hypothetical protein
VLEWNDVAEECDLGTPPIDRANSGWRLSPPLPLDGVFRIHLFIVLPQNGGRHHDISGLIMAGVVRCAHRTALSSPAQGLCCRVWETFRLFTAGDVVAGCTSASGAIAPISIVLTALICRAEARRRTSVRHQNVGVASLNFLTVCLMQVLTFWSHFLPRFGKAAV